MSRLNPLLKISIVVVSCAIVLGSLVASATYLFLNDYKETWGRYAWIWAYVEGYADLGEYGCLTGWIFYVWGAGGGDIWSPAYGSITVSTPPSVVFYEAETITRAEVYVGGELVEVLEARARIVAPPGAC